MTCETCGRGLPCRACGDAFPELRRVSVRTSQNIKRPSVRELLSTEVVASLLRCSPQHVSRLAERAGESPAVVVARGRGRPAFRWRAEQVEALERVQIVRR